MIDMTILLVGLIAVIGLAVAFFGISENSGSDGSSPLLAGVSSVKKFYVRHLKKHKVKCTVLYVNIFYENLQTMMERKELAHTRKQVEQEVLQLCCYNHGEAAQVDGNNYVVATNLPREEIETFCKSFLNTDKRGFKLIDAFIGVYIASGEELDFLKVAGYAKKASRTAKAAGDKYLIANKENLTFILENDNIERNIENFIDNNEFYQMYQPFLDARTGEIVGCEALTRLKNKDANDILPSKFLNALKKEKLYGKFDLYVFEKCCEWAVKRMDQALFITCKFSKSTLAHEGIAEDMISIAAEAGVKKNMIVIQAAQDNIDQDWDVFKRNIMKLKRAGFRFCLDNFGKGYTSFGDISKLSPDSIKLDKSLLYDGMEGPGRIIFDNVVKLAKELHASVFY